MKRSAKIVSRAVFLLVLMAAALAFLPGVARAENNTTIVYDNFVNDNGGANFTVGDTGTNNWLIITNNGQLVNVAVGTIGNAATADRNGAIVTGGGSVWTNSGTLGVGLFGDNNSLTITNGATVYCGRLNVGGPGDGNNNSNNTVRVLGGGRLFSTSGYIAADNSSPNNSGNKAIVSGTGSLWNVGGGTLKIADGSGADNSLIVADGGVVTNANDVWIVTHLWSAGRNSLIITNGGKFYNNSAIYVANDNSATTRDNKIIVTGPGSLLKSSGKLELCTWSPVPDYNGMIVENGGEAYTVGGNVANGNNNSCSNYVSLTGGGLWDVGNQALNVGNANAANIGNVVTNRGGILQFAAALPTITIGAGNEIVFDGGTLSYRDIQSGTLPNLTNNWGLVGVGTCVWNNVSGSNTFRLNNSIASNSLSGPYLFSSTLGATNYGRLEMTGGTNGIRGGGVNILADGSLMISNAEARFQCSFTNFSASVVLTNAMLETQFGLDNQGAALTNFCSGYASGGFQFTSNMPAEIVPGAGIALQGGVLSYRAVTNADVRANWISWPGANTSTNIVLLGSNGFELNWATNTPDAALDQSYTFSASQGATNFAGLAMVNGYTRYRNGSVTLAADGWLLISNTVAQFDGAVTNLGQSQTFNSTVTYADRYAIAPGAVNYVVNSVVNYNGGFFILGTGYTNWIVNGTLSGSGYTVRESDLLGFATASVWGFNTNSSAGFTIDPGGRMWVSNDAYTVFTVPLTNAGAVLISTNAVLRLHRIANTGTITNDHGLFEFTNAAPDITTVAGGIVLTNGGVGYLGITNADVKANWTGYANANGTTGFVWRGANFFQLNNASNRADVSQSYTFAAGLGGSNFVGLRLLGNSVYRNLGGDTVTFGSNGWLRVTNCTLTSYIGNGISNLTWQLTDPSASWDNGGRDLIIGSGSASGNVLRVNAGLVNAVAALTVGNSAGSILNAMIVTNGGRMYESGAAILGNNAAANNNAVTVTGAGSVWSLTGANLDMTIGASGDGNSMTISGGGVVSGISRDGFIGNSSGADGNAVVVTDSGSQWSIGRYLYVGNNGAFNTLSITNGLVSNLNNGYIGNGASGDNNTVTVSGSSGAWTNGAYIYVGASGNDNRLTIADGASASGTQVIVGNASGANANILEVLDGTLTASALMTVGNNAGAHNNSVIVSNATVSSVGLTIGTGAGTNNRVAVRGTTLWNLGGGTLTWGSGTGTNNSLELNSTAAITNVGALSIYEPGLTVTVSPSAMPIVFSGNGIGVGNSTPAPISLVVSNTIIGQRFGFNSVIGNACNNMSLQVINSEWAQIDSGSGGNSSITVGNGAATNNVLTIDNTVVGKTISNNSGVNVINVGASTGSTGNRLTICNGARVYLLNGGPSIRVGNANGANCNRLVVSTNGLLGPAPGQYVDASHISGLNANVYVGNAAGATGNVMIVDAGLVTNAYVYPGANGIGNMLIVTNGGVINADYMNSYIGGVAGANSNSATVTGSGSLWNLYTKTLDIPNVVGATNNVLNVLDQGIVRLGVLNLKGVLGEVNISGGGAMVSTAASTIGTAGAYSNTVTVAGAGSFWDLGNANLTIGAAASTGNVVRAVSGGSITNVGTLLFDTTTSTNNQLIVSNGVFTATNLVWVRTNNTISFPAGRMNLGSATVSNGVAFTVGDGVNTAVLNSTSVSGTLGFSNGLFIAANSRLSGIGTNIDATGTGVTVSNGASFLGGQGENSPGKMSMNKLIWQGGATMVVPITSIAGGDAAAGVNWGLVNVTGAAIGAPGNVIAMAGAPPDMNTNLNLSLKIMTFGAGSSIDTNNITLSTNGFIGGGNWSLRTDSANLYLENPGYTNLAPEAGGLLWTSLVSGVWSAGGNWESAVAPGVGGSSNTMLAFTNSGSSTYTATNDRGGATFTNNALVFKSTSSGTAALAGSNLVFAVNSGTNPVIYQDAAGAFIVSNRIELLTDLTFKGAGAGTVTMATNISGTGGLLFNEVCYHSTILGASNSFVGPVTLDCLFGKVVVSNAFAFGAGNDVTVNNGLVSNALAATYTIGSNVSNVTYRLNGMNAAWNNNARTLTIGSGNAASNEWTVNGGLASNINGVTVGASAGSVYNALAVTNGGRFYNVTADISIGTAAGANSNRIVVGDNGLFNLGGRSVYIGNSTPATTLGNMLTVDAGVVTNAGAVNAGQNGSGNMLIITNGGKLYSTASGIGGAAGCNSNTVIITGANSLWRDSSTFAVPNAATCNGNTLNIAAGGALISTSGTIGNSNNDHSNTVTITGAGSRWDLGNNALTMGTGNPAVSNALKVLSGGALTNATAVTVGNHAAAYSNSVTADGGRLYSTSLTLGANGSKSNSVTLVNASVWNLGGGALTWGSGAGAIGNTFAIDASSSLTNITGLTLGENNTTFAMTNSPGGFVLNEFKTSQMAFNPSFGALTVGSSASVGTALIVSNYTLGTTANSYIGNAGSSNRVSVMRDGTWNVGAQNLYLGNGSAVANVLILDAGFVTNAAIYYQGNGGAACGNSLILTNGGQFHLTSHAYIGNNASAGTNTAVVTGPGSLWNTTAGYLYVGNSGSDFGRLTLDQGAAAYATRAYIGQSAANENTNSVWVGGGALWDVGTVLTVGHASSYGNTLTNQGGVLQFTMATPAITINNAAGGNAVVMDGGTLSYRNASMVAMSENLGADGVGLFTWTGANILRLDNSTAANNSAYTIGVTGDPRNYAGLQLVNGTTAFKGSNARIAIGGTGSMLISNTTASCDGTFTNSGVLTIAASTVTLHSGCTLAGGSTLNWNGTASLVKVYGGDLVLTGSRTLNVTNVPPAALPMTIFSVMDGGTISDAGTWTVIPASYSVTITNANLRLSVSVATGGEGTMFKFR